ncbi:hypothetical protein FSP39_011341 [Pinctada imbricata]|uniref:Uncharacterized protein n=1 Tax=Pinctada imbricata TaxID=66713 RepID=A0AA89BYX6_PINIB|nr:hypothetical protein FSP39_011341 [Pinctada imbricata]
MSSESKFVQKSAKVESLLRTKTLEDEEVQRAITEFKSIVSSARGPNGKIKMIQNSIGGHLTLTSTSCRLLSVTSFSQPVLRLLVSAAQGHLSRFDDGGFNMIILSLNLIEKSLKFQINHKILVEIFEEFLDICLNILETDEHLKLPIQISKMEHISCLVKTILMSKPLCRCERKNLEVMKNLVIRAFLQSLPDDLKNSSFSDRIYLKTATGKSVIESSIHSGLLVEAPDIPTYATGILGKYFTEGESVSVALVTISMSGDTEEHVKGSYQISQDVRSTDVVLNKMTEFCDVLSKLNVKLLLCQKVIHPKIKHYLRQMGIFTMDRLGLQPISYVRDLTGCTPFLSFSFPKADHIGRLTSVGLMTISGRSYLHLQNSNSCLVTLVLCAPQEEAVDELKSLVGTALSTLKHTLSQPFVLPGGGCWQIYLAEALKLKVQKEMSKLRETVQCSRTILSTACRIFTESLQSVAMAIAEEGETHMTSAIQPHYWRVPNYDESLVDTLLMCSCGQVKKFGRDLSFLEENNISESQNESFVKNEDGIISDFPILLDLYSSNVSALKMAILTANTILGIGQFIDDRN